MNEDDHRSQREDHGGLESIHGRFPEALITVLPKQEPTQRNRWRLEGLSREIKAARYRADAGKLQDEKLDHWRRGSGSKGRDGA